MSTIDGSDAKTRKAIPVATGVVDYFPDALIAVAELSRIGNDQHNPGEPLHWSRGKSDDHPDCLMRHFIDRGRMDVDGVRHSTKVAWRALAILQLEIEAMRRIDAAMSEHAAVVTQERAEKRVGPANRRTTVHGSLFTDDCPLRRGAARIHPKDNKHHDGRRFSDRVID